MEERPIDEEIFQFIQENKAYLTKYEKKLIESG